MFRRACLEELVGVIQHRFNELVSEQLETMDKLLYLQSEIERCQDLEEELLQLQEMTKVESIKREIASKKKELKEIQKMFQRQTDDVIRSYQKEQNSVTT
jgi:predicted PilT family ATPase